MARILLSIVLLFAMFSPASAQEAHGLDLSSDIFHMGLTLLGVFVAAKLASDAFARRAVPVADVPTFPRYMTSRQQYRLGSWIFVGIACGFFLLLVYQHRQVIDVVSKFDDVIPKGLLDAVKDQSSSYLAVIAAMGALYLYILTLEKQWNVLLIMRDMIYRWISIPELASQIVAQIRFSLRVPQDAIAAVIASSPGVAEQDFRKDSNTPDRLWAETCYMKWWLTQGHDSGEDATFFAEESFAFDKLLRELPQASRDMSGWKAGASGNLTLAELFDKLKDLHNRFSRLVACYLIYRNGSREELCKEARAFGLDVKQPVPPQYPLRYWIVYVIVLIAAVYIGVYVSAIACDLLRGEGFNVAQDSQRAMTWISYALSNYGLAIVAILLLRSASGNTGNAFNHLITYCWTFIVAFVVGPLGLTIAVHFFSQGPNAALPLLELYYSLLKWGAGPALVCVYISYYLDRQTFQDLPNIEHSASTIGRRLANCLGFTSVTVFLLLPMLLSLTAQPGATWDSVKLRVVATGTIFCLTLALALAAQFALRQGTPAAAGTILSPQTSG